MDSEARSLRTGVALLIVLSVARAVATGGEGPAATTASSVLPTLAAAVDSAAVAEERRGQVFQAGETLDPNEASSIELDRLPGVGPSVAARIVEARSRGVVFESVEDLEQVTGIGPATIARIRPFVRTERVRTSPRRRSSASVSLELNSADSAALLALPGVGPAIAGRILARRRSRPFQTVEELAEVRGIGPASIRRLKPLVRVGRRRRVRSLYRRGGTGYSVPVRGPSPCPATAEDVRWQRRSRRRFDSETSSSKRA